MSIKLKGIAPETEVINVRVKFKTMREEVREILKRNRDLIQRCQKIEAAYRVLDYDWLRGNGLPWLERPLYLKLHDLIHRTTSIERVGRQVWSDAAKGLDDPDLKLPPHLEEQRRKKEKAHRRVFAEEAGKA